jgi:hypothetical protein
MLDVYREFSPMRDQFPADGNRGPALLAAAPD